MWQYKSLRRPHLGKVICDCQTQVVEARIGCIPARGGRALSVACGTTAADRRKPIQMPRSLLLSYNGHSQYHENHGHLPPAYVLGPDGRPWHSWRVLLLEQLKSWGVNLDYHFDEPWDGPHNRTLAAQIPWLYTCPADPEATAHGFTNYFVVIGPGTAFPGAGTTSFADITRPHDETILIVESVGQNVNWMEPRDLTFDAMSYVPNDPNAPSISSYHGYPNVAFVNGTQRSLNNIQPLDLRAMFLIHP